MIEKAKSKAEKVEEALEAAKQALENVSIAITSNGRRICFHCDEYTNKLDWPEHGNPNCLIGRALVKIDAVLGRKR